MDKTKNTVSFRHAFFIGIVCIFSYLVSYYSRQLLGVTSPDMIKAGLFTKDFIGMLSSVYMVMYALGQFVNGILGDIFNPKKMVTCGLLGTATTCMAFPFLPFLWLRVVCYGLFGFSLSMLRGPLVKIISENTEKNHARTICTFFSVASFAGPFVASILSILFDWQWAFLAAGGGTLVICVCAITVLTRFERKGLITYRLGKNEGLSGIFRVFRIERFPFYMVISAVNETAITAVSFWVPTYLTEQLNFAPEIAKSTYAVIAFCKGLMPFLALAFFRLSKENDILLLRVFFAFATGFYLSTAFVSVPWINVLLLAFGLMSMGCVSALLWSIYIPGLGKTGRVSAINGILDSTGYIVAAVCNAVFGLLAQYISWTSVIFLWAGIVAVGLTVALFQKTKGKN